MDTKIFDTLLEPIFIVDQDKNVLYCNEVASAMCDISLRKFQRTPQALDVVFKFKETLHALHPLTNVSTPSPYQESAFTTASGKTGTVQITVQSFGKMGNVDSWLVYFHDVTLEETLQSKYKAELQKKEHVIADLTTAQLELKNYSDNLEKMVSQRTSEVLRLNQTMSALLDSLGQGFFLFDKDGNCLDVYSKACLSIVEIVPAGKKIWEVLHLDPKQVIGLQKWLTTLFAEMLPFEDLAPLGPQKYDHSEGRHIQLQYYPLKEQDNTISAVVVVATDITNLVQAQIDAERERTHAKMILALIKNRRPLSNFIRETQVILNELQKALSEDEFDFESSFRLLHTMKGGFATFAIQSMVEVCHDAETALSAWKAEPTASSFQAFKTLALEVPNRFFRFLDDNRALVGDANKANERWVEIPAKNLAGFAKNLKFSSALQNEFLSSFVMEPASHFVSHYSEVMQQMALHEGKQVAPLQIINGDLRLLPEPYETLFNTLLHAYRNAIDHGIELPEVRSALHKPVAGKIQTAFSIETDLSTPLQQRWLVIQVIDDGGGISPDRIRSRLSAKGVSCEGQTDQQLIQHVFDSQLSTKEVITQSSGRGVGMDAILFAATQLGGTAWVTSAQHHGTTLTIRVPYFEDISDTATIKKVS
jgi:two-component system chemotaxis sensor kinase CheA